MSCWFVVFLLVPDSSKIGIKIGKAKPAGSSSARRGVTVGFANKHHHYTPSSTI